MKKIIVAIDGFSSSGKSTIAKELACEVGYIYVDTGAMYRAVALYAIRQGWLSEVGLDEEALKNNMQNIIISFKTNQDGKTETYLNGENVEGEIRSLKVANGASCVSTFGFVRRELVCRQQQMGKEKGIVMDGRDIGTVVFPEAELKLYVTASPEVRAKRRFFELQAKGEDVQYNDVLTNVVERDERDLNRKESPLKKADDAIEIDNSDMSPDQQMEIVRTLFRERTL